MADDQEEELFLVEGVLSNLQYEQGTANLLAKVEKHYKRNAVVTGVGAAVGDLYGQAASSASLAMYDGEETQNFICMIGDQVACGQFAGAESLPEGETVKAVVSRKKDVLYVEAVMDEKNGLVWIQHPWGTTAEVWANIKLGVGLYLVAMAFLGLMELLDGTPPKVGSSAQLFIWGAIAFGAVMLVMIVWNSNTMVGVAEPSTEAFRLLGFENPEKVNLNGYRFRDVLYDECTKRGERLPPKYDVQRECQYMNVYSLRKAIEDGKVRLKSTQRPA